MRKLERFKFWVLHWVCNFIPYYFTKFKWYRILTYKYHFLVPMALDILHDDIQDYDHKLDMDLYYRITHLSKKEK